MATPILLIAANAPDIDILTSAGGSVNYLHYHRHMTHALVTAPLVAILAVALVRVVSRKQVNWLGAWMAALLGVLSHLLLDLTNTYGVRLLLPFSERWLRLDITNVYDLWLWSVFLVCIAGPFLSRLVGSEIASRNERSASHGRGFAWLALLFLLAYDGGRWVLHQRAVTQLESRIYEGSSPQRVLAVPSAANPWGWRGVVETDNFFVAGDINLLTEFDPTRAMVLHKPAPDPALDAARNTTTFREFLRFSQFPLWRVSPAPDVENGKLVEACDLRFGEPPDFAFVAAATLGPQLQVRSTSFTYGMNRRK